MTSPGETLSLSVPSTELNLQDEQASQRLLDTIHDLGKSALHYVKTSKVVRGALALGLAVSAGTAVGAVTEMAELRPPAAVADTGGYPDWNKPCVAGNPLDPNSSYGKTEGTGYWCSGYQWGDSPSSQNSSRGYGYRNCTDWVAWYVESKTDLDIGGMSHATKWDNNAAAKGLVVRPSGEAPQVGDIAHWEGNDSDPTKDYGHVAIVTSVDPLVIAEYNGGRDGNYRTRTNPAGIDHYIAVPGLSGTAPTPQPPNPYNMNVKFDADTLSDLVVSRYAGGLVVASGAGNTLVDSPPKISLTNWPIPKWAGTADFNGDGSTDVLVEWPYGFGVALGHPNGIFSEGGVTLAGRSSENWAGVGNFYKNDAADTTPRADLVVARPGGGFVVAYGMPNGTLADGPISLPDWTVQSWAGVGDFNGDNYSDILVAKPASAGGGFALALGHPDGIFTFGGNELPGWSPSLWAATGNFAGDAKHDLVVAKPGGGFAIAHPNDNGTLREGQESLFGWSVSSWAGAADIDGNGYTDILIARPEGGFAVALGHSDGIFTPGPVVALPGWGIQNWGGNGAFVGSRGYGYVRP